MPSSASYIERNAFRDRFLDKHPTCRRRLADLARVLVATAGARPVSTRGWLPPGGS